MEDFNDSAATSTVVARDFFPELANRESVEYAIKIVRHTKPYNEFDQSLIDIERLVSALHSDLKWINKEKEKLIMVLYANIITTLETYLGDMFKKLIVENEDLRKELLNEYRFDKKYTIAEIFEQYDGDAIKMFIDHFNNITWHNLEKAQLCYSLIGIHFPSIGALKVAVNIRHNIVHRNGKDDNDELVVLSEGSVHSLIRDTREFILEINDQIIVYSESKEEN